MDPEELKMLLEDFQLYTSLMRRRRLAASLRVSGGCFNTDQFPWARVKGVRVYFDHDMKPRKIDCADGVCFRLEE